MHKKNPCSACSLTFKNVLLHLCNQSRALIFFFLLNFCRFFLDCAHCRQGRLCAINIQSHTRDNHKGWNWQFRSLWRSLLQKKHPNATTKQSDIISEQRTPMTFFSPTIQRHSVVSDTERVESSLHYFPCIATVKSVAWLHYSYILRLAGPSPFLLQDWTYSEVDRSCCY